MKEKGLCVNCSHVKACIFKKEPLVLQCEEFSCDEGRKKK